MKLLDSKGNVLCKFRNGTNGEYRDEHGHKIIVILANPEHDNIIESLVDKGTAHWEWGVVIGAKEKKKILLDMGFTNEQAIGLAYHSPIWHNSCDWLEYDGGAGARSKIVEYLHSHDYLYNSIECKHCKKQIGSTSKEMREYGDDGKSTWDWRVKANYSSNLKELAEKYGYKAWLEPKSERKRTGRQRKKK